MQIVPIKSTGYVDKILPHLYLGDIEVAMDESLLRELHIQWILNLSNEDSYQTYESIEYKHIPIQDSKDVDISKYFDECNDFIEYARNRGENVLVHCMSGVSRSVTIIINYLMKEGFRLRDAYMYVKTIRTRQYTCPNIGFFKQLQRREENVSMTIRDYMDLKNI